MLTSSASSKGLTKLSMMNLLLVDLKNIPLQVKI